VKTEQTWIQCNNIKLYAELHIPESVPAPAMLICHGLNARGFHGLKIYTQLAKTACEAGFVSLVFDFRGVGKSTGCFDYGVGEQEDVKCAINYLASRQEVLSNSLSVVGHSLGGAVSLYAIRNDSRIKSLVLWSTPKNHNYNVKKFVKRTRGKLGLHSFLFLSRLDKLLNVSKMSKLEVYGINLRLRYVREKLMKLNECEAASKLGGIPLLVVIGDGDDIVDVDEMREVFLSAHEPKSFLIIKGANHVYSGKEDELIAKTVDWIKKWK
jgi:alpha/beta superfamily hydrolase